MMGEDSNDVTAPEQHSKVHTVRIAFGLLLLVIAVAVIADNRRTARVGYVFGEVRAPLILVLMIAAVVGAAVGWLLLHRPHHR
jgi:uncharacterized integral membrane protein